jgi:glycosyltransferase involved in cell wall biosynthesis
MNPDVPTVSVLIPTYNDARYLPRAIESVLAQTVKPLEIVVADDGSTDDTAEVVARYGAAVKYRKFDHGGVYALRQAMLGELVGDWFLNLDADNWIEPDFLGKALEIAARHAGDDSFAFVYPDIQRFGDVEDRVERPDYDFATLKRGNYLDMNSLIRTKHARKIGFDAKFNDGQGDYDFFLSLAEQGFSGERLPGGLLHYRVHAGSISFEGRTRFRQLDLAEKILAKHAKLFPAGEARILRQNARRGACLRMWKTVEKLHADGADGQALALGWRAIRMDWRRCSRKNAKILLSALLAWVWRGRNQ